MVQTCRLKESENYDKSVIRKYIPLFLKKLLLQGHNNSEVTEKEIPKNLERLMAFMAIKYCQHKTFQEKEYYFNDGHLYSKEYSDKELEIIVGDIYTFGDLLLCRNRFSTYFALIRFGLKIRISSEQEQKDGNSLSIYQFNLKIKLGDSKSLQNMPNWSIVGVDLIHKSNPQDRIPSVISIKPNLGMLVWTQVDRSNNFMLTQFRKIFNLGDNFEFLLITSNDELSLVLQK